MLDRIVKFNQHGMMIPISLGFQKSEYEFVSKQAALEYINCYSKESFSWEFNNKKIIISDNEVSVIGYPTVGMDYMIIIYQGDNGQHRPPSNAVIYNLDGSIHKILSVPPFISDRLIKRIAENGDSNPPTKLPHPELIPVFKGFSWDKDKDGNIFNYISIAYDRDYGEGRKLNPETGEIGELVDDWYEYH